MKPTVDLVRAMLHDPTTVADLLPAEPSEAEFQEWVILVAKATGWRVAHFAKVKCVRGRTVYWETPARIDGAGFPDLVLVKGPVHAFAELKTNRGALSKEQYAWHAELTLSGANIVLWRPRDRDDIVRWLLGKY